MPDINATFVFYHTDSSGEKEKDAIGFINHKNENGSYGLLVKMPGEKTLTFVRESMEGTEVGQFTKRNIIIEL